MSESEMDIVSSGSDAETTGPGSSARSSPTRSPTPGSATPRSPTPRSQAPTTVPMELYEEQLRRVKQLQGEQAMLIQTINELRKELQELRKHLTPQAPNKTEANAPAQDRPKRKKKASASSSSEDEEAREVKASQPRKKTPEAPTQGPPTAAERTPQRPGPSREAAPEPRAPENKTPKIPPVVIRKKDRWTQVAQMLRARGINYTKARLTSEGVAITAATIQDFRRMTAAFNDTREEYHTFTLEEDRLLRVVIRGIPSGVTSQEIADDLREQGFTPKSVNKMTSRRTGQTMPLALIQVPQDQQKILEVKRCCSLVVRVERQRVQQQATQCHRCQKFGHGQSRCTATPRCVKCGEEHATTTCTKAREEPARCANCGGDHPASYRGCPRYPKAKKTPATTKKTAEERPQARSQPPQTPQAPGPAKQSYAQAAAGKKTATPKPPPASGGSRPESMECVMAQFQQQLQQQMLEAFKTFMSKIPSMLQV